MTRTTARRTKPRRGPRTALGDAAAFHIPRTWRWAHHAAAWALGYFWAPCRLCGRRYGAHEWRDWDGKPSLIPSPGGGSQGICPWCTSQGHGTMHLPGKTSTLRPSPASAALTRLHHAAGTFTGLFTIITVALALALTGYVLAHPQLRDALAHLILP
jgi:hypothetical protein